MRDTPNIVCEPIEFRACVSTPTDSEGFRRIASWVLYIFHDMVWITRTILIRASVFRAVIGMVVWIIFQLFYLIQFHWPLFFVQLWKQNLYESERWKTAPKFNNKTRTGKIFEGSWCMDVPTLCPNLASKRGCTTYLLSIPTNSYIFVCKLQLSPLVWAFGQHSHILRCPGYKWDDIQIMSYMGQTCKVRRTHQALFSWSLHWHYVYTIVCRLRSLYKRPPRSLPLVRTFPGIVLVF